MTEPTINDAIAANVRGHRARLKMTQVELGELMGLSNASVSDIETGRRNIYASELPQFCRAFGIKLDELMQRAPAADIDAMF